MALRPLRILLLWEGEEARALRDHVRKAVLLEWDRSERKHGKLLEFRDVEELHNSAGESFLVQVRDLIASCDCAIALHAAQSRPASDGAGNMWLEFGMWFERYAGDRLWLVTKPGPGVQVPSNLRAARTIEIASAEELNVKLMACLRDCWEDCRSRLEEAPVGTTGVPPTAAVHSAAAATPSPSHTPLTVVERVRATFGDPIADWLQHRLQTSTEDSGNEDGSADVLAFAAELLRMGRAIRELADLSAGLARISARASRLATLGSSKESVPAAALRESGRELAMELNSLLDVETKLLRRKEPGATPSVPPAPLQPGATPADPQGNRWERLAAFLEFRLSRYKDCDDPRIVVQELLGNLRPFIERAIMYSDYKTYTSAPADMPSKDIAARNDTLEYFSEYTKMLAHYLDQLRIEWFSVTRERMNQHFEGFGRVMGGAAPASALQALGRLSGQLPHNTGDWRVPVWPDASSASHGGALSWKRN